VFDVFPDLFAWGVLVLPKDLKPGERRPVVVCQHGRNGVPRDTLDANNASYNNFAAALAERGFITVAPHNLYRGEDRYRWLNRKANTVKATLFSFIIAQHDQILRWLETLPYVAGDRIAFYGLSYGGETAVRVPAILEKYCLSICSGDFNQWTHKVAATDEPFSFMRSIEWEMPYWNLGHTFDYAEMTYLILPRPFMVERGTKGFSGGKKENKLGMRASETAEMIFDNCRIPDTNRLGKVGEGFKITTIELNTEGEVPGIDEKTFLEQAETAKKNCPVSQALAGAEIKLNAKLVRSAAGA